MSSFEKMTSLWFLICAICGNHLHSHKNLNMADQNQNPENQLNIELPEEIAEGVYSNLAIISHSPQEFVIDFVRIMPGIPKAKVKSRVVVTPEHAKRLMKALIDNVKKYESQFGTINDKEAPMMPMNFGPTAQA
jgi:hypothetical protein